MFDTITVENIIIKYTYKKPFRYFAKCDLSNVDDFVGYIKQFKSTYTVDLNRFIYI